MAGASARRSGFCQRPVHGPTTADEQRENRHRRRATVQKVIAKKQLLESSSAVLSRSIRRDRPCSVPPIVSRNRKNNIGHLAHMTLARWLIFFYSGSRLCWPQGLSTCRQVLLKETATTTLPRRPTRIRNRLLFQLEPREVPQGLAPRSWGQNTRWLNSEGAPRGHRYPGRCQRES